MEIKSTGNGYWRSTRRLIFSLLVIWAFVSLGLGIILVEPLNQWKVGALPAGFWMAQQGSIYVFVILIFFYAWRMDHLDQKHQKSDKSDS
ncbi:MAG: DUF4212 domain-containing protein [Opitutaceae bacterium]|nr:DUF4212 domain-containing protein [Opitutaceae bacterium]